jgi:hypothetical protein
MFNRAADLGEAATTRGRRRRLSPGAHALGLLALHERLADTSSSAVAA